MLATFTHLIKITLCIVLFVSCHREDEYSTDEVHVLVDFAIPERDVKSMSGFLHGINIDKPEDSLIALLEPKLLRSGTGFQEAYSRKAKISKKNILVLSDLWYNGPGKKFSVMPYENYEVYKKFLEDVIDQTQGNVIYDIWNEPDVGFIWTGTQQQFYECFKIAHDVIRSKLGKRARISGPSMHFLPQQLNNFAKFCNNNDVQLDVFSYHDLYATDDVSDVQQHLRFIKEITRKYKNLNVQEIQVNEYGYFGSQQNPSLILGYLYNLEKGGADGACRACWIEDKEDNKVKVGTCWNGSIGGLLTNNELKPRASWWAHRLYAESIHKRVQSLSSAAFLANFAYQVPGNQKKARIILANAHQKKTVHQLSVSINSITSLPFVKKKAASVIIKIYKIPDTENTFLDSIVLIEEKSYTINKGKIDMVFSEVSPNTNYILEISEDI